MSDVWELVDMSSDFFDLGYKVDNFKTMAIIIVEFQILLQNFKVSKKIDIVKTYLFWLLRIYLINNPIYLIILTPNKR